MGVKSLRNYPHSRVKRVLFVLLICLVLLLTGLVGLKLANNQQQKKFPTNMALGVNVDMTAIVPGTPYTVTTASGGDFFALAAQLGINTIRITDFRWENTGVEYSQSIWLHVFTEAQHYHIHIVLLLMDGEQDYTVLQQVHRLLGNYGLARAPALWLIDLYNEPDLSDPRRMTLLREEAAYVHQIAPSIPVTIGGWKVKLVGQVHRFDWQEPADIPKLINIVNVVSAHLYQFELGYQQGITPQQWTKDYLDAVQQEAQHKPILLEEFGASNGLAPTDEPEPLGSLQWQTYVYSSVIQEVSAEHDQGVLGALAWIIAPRPPNPHPGPTTYEGDMTGWALVLDHGRRILPAAKVFSSPESVSQAAPP